MPSGPPRYFIHDIVDEEVDVFAIGNEFDQTEMKRVMTTASMCTPHIATMRPDMNRVQMLRGEDRPAELQHKTCQRAPVIVNACYLLELIRHRQLLMECVEKIN
ncbi:hypothetical protein Bca4012_046002 [Brassica carinata]|uniref:Uncharacterized protein n=1 Tax=Brassica carinata TaxID=52824 RepID=A0A8X7QSR9_BRACI|nr:hypothetical protein Bca52824_056300 [Brassica carinata]